MAKTLDCIIKKNIELNPTIYEMTVSADDLSWIGLNSFINIQVPGCYLRRPMAVSSYTKTTFSFIYEVVGEGTKKLTSLQPNTKLNILVDIGNCFTFDLRNGPPLLISGGVGLGPIMSYAYWLKRIYKFPFYLIVGFANKDKAIKIEELKKLNKKVIICSDDGSIGEKGNVIDMVKKHKLGYCYTYACGNINMLKALHKNNIHGQYSLDERMGCGFGACMGCSIMTKRGPQRICKNGPCFKSEDLLW